ncbi:MAG TPA: class I SAM-dependent methyltransferase [Opitutaceae bacterium]|nr:class I SAM-dependent methyltransferase [Opitutaceae bacterium]
MPSLRHLRDRIVQKFVRDPAGYGRPVPKEALDGEYRSGHWDHFFGFAELPRNLVLAGAVSHRYPRPAVLDLGCGSGRLAQVFRVYPFSRYLGVDLSSEGVARARGLNLPGTEFIEGNYETWRPDESFDAIIFNECIGYARDPAATLAAFARHLSPDGRFFLSHFRFGSYAAQWKRMETVCTVDLATAVMSPEGQIWDIKILRPRAAA